MLLCQMQSADESVKSFIADCFKIAAHCDYGTEADNTLRDRIANGLFNGKLHDELIFSERALTLKLDLAKIR